MDSPTGLFDIDHSKGTVIALEGLDVGVYSLNISVHDGKFTSFGEAMVSVDLVNDEMLANAVIMRYVIFWLYVIIIHIIHSLFVLFLINQSFRCTEILESKF